MVDSGYTTAEGGTGFGLTTVEQIAEARGWSAAARESESGGARFEFTGVDAGSTNSRRLSTQRPRPAARRGRLREAGSESASRCSS